MVRGWLGLYFWAAVINGKGGRIGYQIEGKRWQHPGCLEYGSNEGCGSFRFATATCHTSCTYISSLFLCSREMWLSWNGCRCTGSVGYVCVSGQAVVVVAEALMG